MSKRAGRGPSIIDVAREAGVSPQTVSRVVNGQDVVREPTLSRVQAAMKKLGYRPNSAARALKSGRFNTIGVIVSDLINYGNVRTLEALAHEAAGAGYSLTLTPVWSITQTGVAGAVAHLNQQSVDGVIVVLQAHELAEADLPLRAGMPAVLMTPHEVLPYPRVGQDQGMGARQAVEHLLDLGHETVWHVRGPENVYATEGRIEGWRSALEDRGCRVPEILPGDWSVASGYAAGQQLARDPDVTAVFCANDEMAFGLIHALNEAGRSVPADVSVIGFDDGAMAEHFVPPLTTVHQHFDRVGVAAIESLLAQIEHRPFEAATILPTELVVRASTAPPRA